MNIFILLVAIFIFQQPLIAMEKIPSFDQAKNLEHDLLVYDHKEIEKIVGELPKEINSLKSLQSYATHYVYFSDKFYRQYKPYIIAPHLNLLVKNGDNEPGLKRIGEIFSTSLNNFNFTTLVKGALPGEDPGDSRFIIIFLGYLSNQLKKDKIIQDNFSSFLIKNNADLFPDHEIIFNQLNANTTKIKNSAISFKENILKLNANDIAKWLETKTFFEEDKARLSFKIDCIIADLDRLIVNLNYMSSNADIVQILELYFFAEQSFNNLRIFNRVIEGMIKTGQIFHDNPEEYFKISATIENAVAYELVQTTKIANIHKLFHHRQFPLRSLYLLSRAVAFSLRDFANNFRARAGLSPIPDETFEQSDIVKNALLIDETLANLEDVIKLKMSSAAKTWTNDALKPTKRKAAPLSPRSTKKEPPKYTPKKLKKEPANKVEKKIDIVILPPKKSTLGERVYRLLDDQEKVVLGQLFSLKEHTLSDDAANTLTMAVYRALIDLNKAEHAAEFLKRSSDSRIFTKGKTEEFLSKESLEYRLLPYLLQDLLHPDFSKENLVNNSAFLHERVLTEKLKLYDDEIDSSSITKLNSFLHDAETLIYNAEPGKKRTLLVNLAHTWHKLSIALESKKDIKDKASLLAFHKNKIIELLEQALPIIKEKKFAKVTVLEAYLFTYYLNLELEPEYERLSPAQINNIQQQAKKTILSPPKVKTIHKVSPSGKKLGEYEVDNSLFHAVTGDELGDYILVVFNKSPKERKIPLFIHYNNTIYRTDVFGGSRLKPDPKNGDYGSLFAVSLQAADFFKSWFTSNESFWYGQRAFMPTSPDEKTKAARGILKISTIPDQKQLEVFAGIIVQDGFGVIKASKADSLNLEPVSRPLHAKTKNVASQALQAYDSDQGAALELFKSALHTLDKDNFNNLAAEEQANNLMGTLPKITAIGIPVSAKKILMPNTTQWLELGSEGYFIGRNPYSAKRIQIADKNDIIYTDILVSIPVFQYTLTGYIQSKKKLNGSFFKGLLAVIPDEHWPTIYKNSDILLSSKDQKLNQRWLTEDIKNRAKERGENLNFIGMLVVKEEYHKKHLVGLPVAISDNLAGDYDGDPYDIMPRKGFSHLSTVIAQGNKEAIANPKPQKSFTKRQQVGNFKKILDLRKPLSSTWNGIVNRFYYLPKLKREQLISVMAQNHMLKAWLGEKWQNNLQINHLPTDKDIVIAEMQLGVKYGEDAYKTSVDIESVLMRAYEYEKALDKLGSKRQIPYSKGLKKKLDYQEPKDALKPALEPKHSSNMVDKVFRAIARYLNHDSSYDDGYLSDEE